MSENEKRFNQLLKKIKKQTDIVKRQKKLVKRIEVLATRRVKRGVCE